jgi:hypothetical protein
MLGIACIQNPTMGKELEAFTQRQTTKVEEWLDAGHGCCVLKNQAARCELERCLCLFDRERYEMGAFAIPANHVHAIVKPLGSWALEELEGAWKQFSAKRINHVTGKRGGLWQDESFDRIVRDTPHLRKVIGYLSGNVAKTSGKGAFWLRSDWRDWHGGVADGLVSSGAGH